MTENYNMEFQERLSRLFDGELNDNQAEAILNEVAENSELQALYLEQKALHSYLQNPYMPATIDLKEGILTRIKLDAASIRKYIIRKYIMRSAFVGLFLLAFGGAYLLWNNNLLSDKNINKGLVTSTNFENGANNNNSENKALVASKNKVPIVTQSNLDSKSNDNLTKQNLSSNRSTKAVSGNVGFNSRKINKTKIDSKTELFAKNETAINSELATNSAAVKETEQLGMNLLTYSNMYENSKVTLDHNNSLPKYFLNPVYNYKTALILDRLSLQFNWYGLSTTAPSFIPKTTKTGILNDFSLFLMYEITERTSFGLSFGYDNFLMQYEGWEGNTQYRYKQEYSTPWTGCNINHRFEPILTFADYYEVSPYVQLNTAYANVGIYTQASAGIELGLSANTSLLVGFNSGWLFYKYENYEFTNKNGLNIGLKYGF
jgi:hypothetical protein